jgi:hypothetical protein
MEFRGSYERHIRPVRIAVEIEILLGDDHSQRLSLDSTAQSYKQKIAKKVMTGGIARHVNKFSVNQFVIVRESGWQALELLNCYAGTECHTDYCSLLGGAPASLPI